GGTCAAERVVVASAQLCDLTYPSEVSLTWNCTDGDARSVTGSGEVTTAMTSASCPATTVSVSRTITFDRSRAGADHTGELSGTATIEWTGDPASTTVDKHV